MALICSIPLGACDKSSHEKYRERHVVLELPLRKSSCESEIILARVKPKWAIGRYRRQHLIDRQLERYRMPIKLLRRRWWTASLPPHGENPAVCVARRSLRPIRIPMHSRYRVGSVADRRDH